MAVDSNWLFVIFGVMDPTGVNWLGVIFLGAIIAFFLLRALVRLSSNPESRKIVKIFLLLPFLLLGSLLLAVVVLVAAYRLSAVSSPEVTVAHDGTRVRIGGLAVDVNAPGKPGPAAQPEVLRNASAGSGDSNVARMYRAVKTAFLTTLQSTLEKKSPSGVGSAKPVQGSEVAARPEAASKQPLPMALAPAAVKPGDAKAAVAVSASPAPASPPAVYGKARWVEGETASTSPAPATPPAAAKRPDWIDSPPQPSTESYEVAVNSGPWKTRLECEQALNEEIGLAVDNYVAWQLGEEARSQVSLPEDAVRNQLLAEQWLEKVDTKFGEQMFNLHALLKFDSQIDSKLREAWNQLLVTGRIVGSGVILGGALLLLAVIYAYLRFSLTTAQARSQSAG